MYLCFCVDYLFIFPLECGFVVYFLFCELVTFFATVTKSFIRELTTRFLASHLMNVMGIVICNIGFKVMLRRISMNICC